MYSIQNRSTLNPGTITTLSAPDLPVYGLDRELQQKQASKYNRQQEAQAKQWISQVLKEDVFAGEPDFIESLKTGVILVRLVNKIEPGCAKLNLSAMPFMQMENIQQFLKACEKLGVPKFELFQTVDLYERKNPSQVLSSVFAFARHAQKKYPNLHLPGLGPALGDEHHVEFTSHQLQAGKFMPSQQSVRFRVSYDLSGFVGKGYYAAKKAAETGATGSGIQYGTRRQIISES